VPNKARGPFLWFGAKPGDRLPSLTAYPIAKHTKGNAQGVKLPRPNLRVVPRSAFQLAETVADVAERLFGGFPGAVSEGQLTGRWRARFERAAARQARQRRPLSAGSLDAKET
jgi:hypothetical protein